MNFIIYSRSFNKKSSSSLFIICVALHFDSFLICTYIDVHTYINLLTFYDHNKQFIISIFLHNNNQKYYKITYIFVAMYCNICIVQYIVNICLNKQKKFTELNNNYYFTLQKSYILFWLQVWSFFFNFLSDGLVYFFVVFIFFILLSIEFRFQ